MLLFFNCTVNIQPFIQIFMGCMLSFYLHHNLKIVHQAKFKVEAI